MSHSSGTTGVTCVADALSRFYERPRRLLRPSDAHAWSDRKTLQKLQRYSSSTAPPIPHTTPFPDAASTSRSPRRRCGRSSRIAWVLRSYVRQLRTVRRPRAAVPGSLAPELEPLHVCAPTIDIAHDVGPFADANALNDHLNRRKSGIHKVPVPLRFVELEPCAFVHNDLHMRDIILGDDGRV
ncbi:hypothetical protein PsYK624_102140 [Phanerochaete sordida]|uniref:Aminoglycoside phosphotransferase domain-containing protein n=1 Tax=Phanerochaete sordida TaxID=48140 RepID=A0A9P3LFZ7_9APHY|nr:hypothetical protein PsYK624_102140 [Phanerochaete sordida]